MQVHRSCICVGWSTSTSWTLASHHRTCQSVFCRFCGIGWMLSPPVEFLQVMHAWSTQFVLLCPLMGFPGGYPLSIGWVITSYCFLLRLCLFQVIHPISSLPTKLFCTCIIELAEGWGWLHSSSSSWRINISSSQHTSTQNMSYTQVHTYKVSVPVMPCIYLCLHLTLASLDRHVPYQLWSSFLQDGGLDIWGGTHSYTKPAFYTSFNPAKHEQSSLGEHMLC